MFRPSTCPGLSRQRRFLAPTQITAAGQPQGLLEVLRETYGVASHLEDVDAWTARQQNVILRAWQGDRDAEVELQALGRRFPANQDYRAGLMMAALTRGDLAAANTIADNLAAEPDIIHETHLHIAQFYARAGDRGKARHQFGLAWQTACNDADREDVIQAMEIVGIGT